jgi:hypothetical protein
MTMLENGMMVLPIASITSMDQLEEVFLRIWNVKEDPNMLLQIIMHINKDEKNVVKELHAKFKRIS